MTTEKNNRLAFFITAAVFLGCFGGFYTATKMRVSGVSSSPLEEADKIISSGTADPHELEKASDLSGQVLTKEPKNCKALMVSALSFQRRGLIAEAINRYQQLIPEAETFSKFSYYNLGTLLELVGKDTEAETQYTMSLARENRIPAFWANLIKLHIKMKKIPEAKTELQNALTIMPQAPELLSLKPLVGL